MDVKPSYPLLEKAEAFALRIVKLYQYLQDKGERVMSKQVLRSGYLPDDVATQSLVADCSELLRLLAASIKTAKRSAEN